MESTLGDVWFEKIIFMYAYPQAAAIGTLMARVIETANRSEPMAFLCMDPFPLRSSGIGSFQRVFAQRARQSPKRGNNIIAGLR